MFAMNDTNPEKPIQELPSDKQEDEETIFPPEDPKEAGPFGKVKNRHFIMKMLGVLALIVIIYLLGHFTRPDTYDESLAKIKSFVHLGVERAKPLQDSVTRKITEFIDTRIGGEESPQVPTAATAKESTEGKKIKYWHDPMIPGFVSDKPGKSPMGMDMIPVYEDADKGNEGIRINPTTSQNIGVKTEKVRKRTLTREIRTIGRLTYDERKVNHVHTKYEGWIEKLYVDFTGQEVNENDLMVEVYSPELVSTQEELLLALKYSQTLKENPFPEISTGAESLLESTRRRLELFDVPSHQIDELMRERKITKTMHIHSPFRGFVIKKNVSQGMYVKPGMSLYTIADLSNIWVMVDIYEYELPWIQIGQEAEMTLSYYPGKKFTGKVTYIDPFLESQTRTIKLRLEFANPDWELKPDMYANVSLKSVIAKKSIAVPEEAVIHSGERDIVIIQHPSGRFESRNVTLGAQVTGYYEVLKGLSSGDKVVTSSSFMIDSESKLQEAINKLQEGGGTEKTVKPEMKRHEPQRPMVEEKQNHPPGIIRLEPEHDLHRKH